MLSSILNKVNDWCIRRVESFGAQYTAFGVFGLINYLIPYFMWSDNMENQYLLWGLRLAASLLCFGLFMKELFPRKARRFFSLYWFITLLYCLPFMATYLLFFNQLTTPWLMNMALAMFLLSLLVDWVSFIVLVILGLGCGMGFYFCVEQQANVMLHSTHLELAIYTCIYAVMIGFIFSRNKSKIEHEKLSVVRGLGESMAHEMRTPLSGIRASLRAMESILEQEKKQSDQAEKLKSVVTHVDDSLERSLKMIDMLLVNARGPSLGHEFPKENSIRRCINVALEEYPFCEGERTLIEVDETSEDFIFAGSKYMMVHALFNLIKNAIYYVRAANKGKISFRTESSGSFNYLIIRDTGSGMSQDDVAHLFTRFFSGTLYGKGLGLYFCKQVMDSLGGGIECESELGEYTEFTLRFPKV